MVRRWFYSVSLVLTAVLVAGSLAWPPLWWSFAVVAPLILLGLRDSLQQEHTILRNFPLLGRLRYGFEAIRPEVQQYFIENNIDAFPIEREFRALVYRRAKGELETHPFGTQRDVYGIGYEWAPHSVAPVAPPPEKRIRIGGPDCLQPYDSSLLNISAMSYGALSNRAVLALNRAAREGGFAHNTGEGGISPHHLEHGGDLIFQVGTGYFGCRTPDGDFDEDRFAEEAARESVRMIELKLSQGAKPGHGGVLPGAKVTPEIAAIRHVPVGQTVLSPPGHRAFSTPRGLIEFIGRLRALAGGKPVGFKLCLGKTTDFFAICKAMVETGTTPDFISVDGGEGGTGAAPLEFSNSIGAPARGAWIFVHSALRGVGLRERIKIVASGKIFSGFHMLRALALGADLCASARGMMLALGCIQALRCNSGYCPTGITTHHPALVNGLVVEEKWPRVRSFHERTIHALNELLGAMGIEDPDDLRPHHIYRRIDDLTVRHYDQLYPVLDDGQLLEGSELPTELLAAWQESHPDRFNNGRAF